MANLGFAPTPIPRPSVPDLGLPLLSFCTFRSNTLDSNPAFCYNTPNLEKGGKHDLHLRNSEFNYRFDPEPPTLSLRDTNTAQGG